MSNSHTEDPAVSLEDIELDTIQVITKEDTRIKERAVQRRRAVYNLKVKGISVGLVNNPSTSARAPTDRFDHYQLYEIRGGKQVLLEGNGSNGTKPEHTRRTGHVYE